MIPQWGDISVNDPATQSGAPWAVRSPALGFSRPLSMERQDKRKSPWTEGQVSWVLIPVLFSEFAKLLGFSRLSFPHLCKEKTGWELDSFSTKCSDMPLVWISRGLEAALKSSWNSLLSLFSGRLWPRWWGSRLMPTLPLWFAEVVDECGDKVGYALVSWPGLEAFPLPPQGIFRTFMPAFPPPSCQLMPP